MILYHYLDHFYPILNPNSFQKWGHSNGEQLRTITSAPPSLPPSPNEILTLPEYVIMVIFPRSPSYINYKEHEKSKKMRSNRSEFLNLTGKGEWRAKWAPVMFK